MIESLLDPSFYEVAAAVGTIGLSVLAGRAWGKRAIATTHATRALLDQVSDAIEDGTLTPAEAEQIALAVQSVITAAQG